MPIQSLGIFDRVFDWVVDKIFSPIIDWLSKILNSIFEWILNTIVIPLLKPVFDFLWNIVIANIADLFYTFIYTGYCKMLWLLDQLQSGFDVLIGLKDVTYTSADTGVKTQSTLLQYFMNNEIIRNAVISITFIALALSVIFAIYAVMRSTLDFDFEGKRPVGRVLNSVAKTMIAFLLVPVIAVFGVSLASIVLKQTCTAISGGDASLGKWVLAISSIDAGRGNPPTPFTNPSTGLVNEPWASLVGGETDYITFGLKIHVSQIDYLLGYASIIFMSIVMIMCLFTFIKRIFDIMIMYITSPYFVSTIVLDDGEKFKRWRENFIARVLVGFGSVIGMRIFLMMVPVIMNDQLKIFDSVAGNITGGYVIRLVFILGGMFAVYKSSTLLTGIISANVAAEENMNNAMVGGLLMAGAKKGGSFLWSKGKAAFGEFSKKSKAGGSGGANGGAGGSSNKFSGGSGMNPGKGNFPQNSLSEQQKKQKFGAAVAGATGKHDNLDTSDYAPLYGENKDKSYLKDGAQVKDKQKGKDSFDDALGDIHKLYEPRQKNTLSDKEYDDTLSSVSELFSEGGLGSSNKADDDMYDGISNLFNEGDNAYSNNNDNDPYDGLSNLFNENSDNGTSAQDIVKPANPLESARHTSSSASGTSSSSGSSGSAQYTGGSSSGSSGSAQYTGGSSSGSSGSAHYTGGSSSGSSGSAHYSGGSSSGSSGSAQYTGGSSSSHSGSAQYTGGSSSSHSDSAQYSGGSSSGNSGSSQYTGGTGSVDSTFKSAANDPLINPESKIASSVSSASGSARPVDTAFSSATSDPLKNTSQNSARPVDTKFTPASDDPLLRPRNNHKNDSGKF